MKPHFDKFIAGNFGLCYTFWGSWVVGIFLSSVLYPLLGYKLGFVFMAAYTGVAAIGIWRAADKYQGEKIWIILSKIGVAFGVISTLRSLLFIF